MEFIKCAKQLLSEWKKKYEEKVAKRREARRVLASELELDIREFDGELYIAHQNVPIVNIHHLNTDIVDVLLVSRETLVAYKKKYH